MSSYSERAVYRVQTERSPALCGVTCAAASCEGGREGRVPAGGQGGSQIGPVM